MPDRFVLEDDITHQSDISDQINLLIEDILDNPDLIDADDLVNTLNGIIAVHDLRTNKLWQHFKMIYELGRSHVPHQHPAATRGNTLQFPE